MRNSKRAAKRPRRDPGGTGQRARARPSAGTRILAAIEEATELLRSEGLQSRRLTVRTYRLPPAPRDYRPEDVKRVRELQRAEKEESDLAELLRPYEEEHRRRVRS